MWLPLLLLCATLASSEPTPTLDSAGPEVTFTRCCPEDKQFSLRQQRCVPAGDFTFGRASSEEETEGGDGFQIEPPFASVYQSVIYDYNYDGYEGEEADYAYETR